jgi:hypothetical protein
MFCFDPIIQESIIFFIFTKEKTSLNLSHPFSVNNLMLYNGSSQAASTNVPFGGDPFSAFYRPSLYGHPLYSSELAHHFASWWPAAAAAGAAFYNSHTQAAAAASSHIFPFSPAAAFSAAAAAANYHQQQQQYAAALSRFSPSLFMPPAPSQTLSNKTNILPPQPINQNMNHFQKVPSSSPSSSPFSSTSTTSSSSHSNRNSNNTNNANSSQYNNNNQVQNSTTINNNKHTNNNHR